jgi:hypothetical protein
MPPLFFGNSSSGLPGARRSRETNVRYGSKAVIEKPTFPLLGKRVWNQTSPAKVERENFQNMSFSLYKTAHRIIVNSG